MKFNFEKLDNKKSIAVIGIGFLALYGCSESPESAREEILNPALRFEFDYTGVGVVINNTSFTGQSCLKDTEFNPSNGASVISPDGINVIVRPSTLSGLKNLEFTGLDTSNILAPANDATRAVLDYYKCDY